MKEQEVGTIVGSSVHLTGAIKDTSDITIFGSVEGEVNSDQKVIIEDTALVKGPITANEVIVSGIINGTVTAKGKIEINPTGLLKGNIDTEDLLIHSGATFIGECKMPDKKSPEATATPEQEEFKAEVEQQGEEEKEEKEEDEDKE